MNRIERVDSNGADLWVLRGVLGGTWARLLSAKVDLHFSENGSSLFLDLRETSLVDNAGAEVLEQLFLRHAGFFLVGHPRRFDSLPLSVRTTLTLLRPAKNFIEALSILPDGSSFHRGSEKRCHRRVSVQIPVEIFLGRSSTAATIYDLSPEGNRVGPIPYKWIPHIREERSDRSLLISGMGFDPIGKEIARRFTGKTIHSLPVHLHADNAELGVKFLASPSRVAGDS